jgi:hypothetical protein
MWNYHHPYQHLNGLINVFMVRRFFAFIDPPVLHNVADNKHIYRSFILEREYND